VAQIGHDEAMQSESGSSGSHDRDEVNQEIVSALSALSDDPTTMAGRLEAHVAEEPGGGEIQIDGLSDDDVELFRRLAEERGITVEELLAQVIRDRFQQSARLWLAELWKQYFAGLRVMFRRPGSQPAPAKDEDSGQSPGTST
jgi:hypothetical protein